MIKHRNYKVLHAPTSVGGNPQGISRALNKLGVSSVNWVFRQNYFAYSVDREIWRSSYGLIKKELARLLAIVEAIWSYDVVHYNWGSTLAGARPPLSKDFPNLIVRLAWWLRESYLFAILIIELKILRALGKPVFVHFQGNDVRQGDFLRSKYKTSVADIVTDSYYHDSSDQFKRRIVREFDHVCDQIYALNPDLMWVLPARAKFQAYGHVCLDEWQPVYCQLEIHRPLRIGHAPSNRAVKGTDFIVQALNELNAEGLEFEFILVEGMSNSEARQCYESIDVLVDQLHIGWYGGLAVEAMALGKPVIVYVREEDLGFVPEEMRADLPFIRASSSTIKEVLRFVITMPRYELLHIAKLSRSFVERWHDPIKIAAEIKADYEEALRQRGKL